ncbi:hypothetical protein HDU98_004962 [Podochytrium sp. JEL0797]|nr:hypothetical protein HDU98_004962 [Podochytrium sp. JEL0797]
MFYDYSSGSDDDFPVSLVSDTPLLRATPAPPSHDTPLRSTVDALLRSCGMPALVEEPDATLAALVLSLAAQLGAAHSASRATEDAYALAASDLHILVERVARLKAELRAKEDECVALRGRWREADDSCRDAVLKGKTTEKELKAVKSHLLELVHKMGCCRDGIAGFMKSTSTPPLKGRSSLHGLPCDKCARKTKQSKSTCANWIDGVGFVDNESATSPSKPSTPSPSFLRRSASNSSTSTLTSSRPSTPIPKRPSTPFVRRNSAKLPVTTIKTGSTILVKTGSPTTTRSPPLSPPTSPLSSSTPVPRTNSATLHQTNSPSPIPTSVSTPAHDPMDPQILETLVKQHAELLAALMEPQPSCNHEEQLASQYVEMEQERMQVREAAVQVAREWDELRRERERFDEKVRCFEVSKVLGDLDDALAGYTSTRDDDLQESEYLENESMDFPVQRVFSDDSDTSSTSHPLSDTTESLHPQDSLTTASHDSDTDSHLDHEEANLTLTEDTISLSPVSNSEPVIPAAAKAAAPRPGSVRSLVSRFSTPTVTKLATHSIPATHAALYAHHATRRDEVSLTPGDLVHVIETSVQADAGWVRVLNLTQGKGAGGVEGVVPLACLGSVKGVGRLVVGVSSSEEEEGVGEGRGVTKGWVGAVVGDVDAFFAE